LSLARPVTYETNSRARGRLDLPRRGVFIWAAAILFSNNLFGVVNNLHLGSPDILTIDANGISIFQGMAWYAIFRLLGASDAVAIRWLDAVIAAGLSLLVLLPTDRMIWVAAAGLAIYLWIFNRGDAKLRGAATVLAALSVQQFWGHFFFNLVAAPLLRAETAVVGAILEVVRPGTSWQDNLITGPSGFSIIVYPACSSFHNVSLAMLCWITVSRLRRQNWQSCDLLVGGAVVGVMVLLNIARLCLMAWDFDLYDYWHEGRGEQIFAIGASLTIVLISLYGSRPTKRLR
jgi:exosortase/archaeosortase family protein